MTTRPPGVRLPTHPLDAQLVAAAACSLCHEYHPIDVLVWSLRGDAFCETCAYIVCATCDSDLQDCQCRDCPAHGGYLERPDGCPECQREAAGDAERQRRKDEGL